ncbi:hypothetical protein MASR2M47_22080 [Draconibacterium sp.]
MIYRKEMIGFLTLLLLVVGFSSSGKKHYSVVKIGMCTDVHLPTMHDSEYRITTFIDAMKKEKPDFIIELGDFGTPEPKYAKYFDIWNSFPGDKYHVIGNHEMDGGTSREKAIEYRDMKSGYYSFEKNGFHFIVLDGNDKKDPEAKGYKQFIGPQQVEWLQAELAKTEYPVVIFSHQGLAHYSSADEEYGVENYKQMQQILETHNAKNPQKKVLGCFNGHTHYDYAENINGIWYITITSMSYHWLGDNYECVRYSDEVDKNFKWIKYTAPFKEPLFTTVEISTKGTIKIAGKKSEWVGPTPFQIGYPLELKKFMRPEISKRNLKFKMN